MDMFSKHVSVHYIVDLIYCHDMNIFSTAFVSLTVIELPLDFSTS